MIRLGSWDSRRLTTKADALGFAITWNCHAERSAGPVHLRIKDTQVFLGLLRGGTYDFSRRLSGCHLFIR